MNCAIIIPCINLDNETKLCVKKCLKQKNIKIKIYIVSDKKIIRQKKDKKIKYLSYGPINMSEKRNKAVNACREKYIAFIDSDAYPDPFWISNGIKILKRNKKIGLVSGPDLPFPNQKGWQKIIGEAHKSFWLSGSKTYRKNTNKSVYCSQVSSCNMIMEKSTYKTVKGMNKKIYIAEDADFCNKIRKNYKIWHSNKVKIFHKSRNFLPFLMQRYSYGTCIFDVFDHTKIITNVQYIIPLLITLFFFTFPFILTSEIYKYIYYSVFVLFFINFSYEAVKCTKNLISVFKVIIIFYLSILLFGLGSLMRIFNLTSNLKKIYTYRS